MEARGFSPGKKTVASLGHPSPRALVLLSNFNEKTIDHCVPLAYSLPVQTVVETLMYLRAAEDLYSEADREEIVRTIAAAPEAGDLMPGTGGYRKLRFARSGMGKRGGARVIYLYGGEDLPIFLITVYAKSEKGNLSKAEQNALAKMAKSFFADYKGKR
jgi:hypothetical protein